MKIKFSGSIALILLASVINLSGENGPSVGMIIQRSQQLLMNGQHAQATELLTSEIAMRSGPGADAQAQSENMQLRGLLGDIYMELYQSEKAVEQYDEIIKLNPNFAFPYFMKGKALATMQGRTLEALETYQISERLGYAESELYSGIGWCFMMLTEEGNLDEAQYKQYVSHAISYFKAAISKDPENLSALGNLADLQFNIGNYEGAIKNYERLTKNTPGKAPILIRMGDAYIKVGKIPEAIEILIKAQAALPKISELHNNLDKSVVIDSMIRIQLYLGQALTLKKRFREAKRAFETVIVLTERTELSMAPSEKKMFQEKAQKAIDFFTSEPGFQTFTSKGHEKAGELDFSLDYPNGWFAKESKKTSTLKVFWEYPSSYCDSISIVIPPGQNLDKPDISHERFLTLFESPRLSGVPSGTISVQKKLLEDYKYPAGFVDYFRPSSSKKDAGQYSVRKYIIYLGNQMVWVVFSFYPEEDIDKFKDSGPWMETIIDSLVQL